MTMAEYDMAEDPIKTISAHTVKTLTVDIVLVIFFSTLNLLSSWNMPSDSHVLQ